MAVVFNDSANQYINFGSPTGIRNLASRTVLWKGYFTAIAGAHVQYLYVYYPTGSSDEFFGMYIDTPSATKTSIQIGWSGGAGFGVWQFNTPSTGQHDIAWTYSNTSTSNNPVVYVDGVSVAVTTAVAPSGTYRSGTSSSFLIGSDNIGTKNFNGYCESLPIYNRIAAASEIADWYASRLAIPDARGLVFAPQLWGAASLQMFDGTTLGGTNYIIDAVSGAQGTPSGSPVGRGDTYLTFGDTA